MAALLIRGDCCQALESTNSLRKCTLTHGSLRVHRYKLPVCRDGGEMTPDLDHMSLSVG